MNSETRTIAVAAAALDDRLAQAIRQELDVLLTENDLDKRRVAENRFLRLTNEAKP